MRQPVAIGWVRDRGTAGFDLVVALVTTVVEISLMANGSGGIGRRALALSVLAGAALVFRRRAPLPVLAGTILAAVVLVISGENPAGATVLVALFTVADRHERRVSVAALVPTMVFLQAASISSVPVSIIAWALGAYWQTRQRYTAALEERATHLERERAQLDQIAVHAERAAIARELHDVVAHSVTVMLLGVRGAKDVLRTAPDVAEDILGRVETSAEQSIAELRRILVLLRSPEQVAEIRPAPGLSRLDELVADYRNAGLPVELELTGQRRPLPSGVELSVYRIVEEALTNVLKHAGPAVSTSVRLSFGSASLEIVIEDDGDARQSGQPVDPGHGLRGMRERVLAFGGDCTAGPRPESGFRVWARIPLVPDEPVSSPVTATSPGTIPT